MQYLPLVKIRTLVRKGPRVWSAEFGHLSLNKFLDKGDPISGSVTTLTILKCLLIKLPKEILVFQQGEDLRRILRPRNFVATYW